MLPAFSASDDDKDGPKNQARHAYQAIRTGILRARYRPDEKLKVLDIAQELSLSPGAVREALSRMIPERLVVSRDQKGYAVAPLSIDDLKDLTELRCGIEAMALRASIKNATLDWDATLVAAEYRLRATTKKSTGSGTKISEDWIAAHAAFHAAFVSACGSPRLIALHDQLYEQSERYRMLSSYVDEARNVPDEHHTLIQLALDRQTEQLVSSMTAHIRATSDLIINGASL